MLKVLNFIFDQLSYFEISEDCSCRFKKIIHHGQNSNDHVLLVMNNSRNAERTSSNEDDGLNLYHNEFILKRHCYTSSLLIFKNICHNIICNSKFGGDINYKFHVNSTGERPPPSG